MMGAHVTITDVPAVRYLLEENVKLNITQEGELPPHHPALPFMEASV